MRVLILVLVTFILAFYSGELTRRIGFFFVGSVGVDGLTIFLDPNDTVITKKILDSGTWEPEITATIRDLLGPGDTFIDVGTNIGWFTLIASREVGEQGRVIAFEPDPVSFDILRRNAAVNNCQNVVLEQMGLSNRRGRFELYIHDTNKGGHSFLKSAERSKHVEVEALPLDEYLRESERKIDVVKIDTEGAEGRILEGMQKTIRSQDKMDIVMEFTPGILRKEGTDPETLIYRLQESSYLAYMIDHPSGDLVPIEKSQVPKLIEVLEESSKYVNMLFKRSEGKN